AGGHAALVQTAGGILDEAHLAAPLEEAADRRVVADVGGDAEDSDLVGIEPREQPLRVRVREDVEALLQEQELAALDVPLGQRRERDRNRILLLRLRDLARAARPAQTVGWICPLEVGLLGDLVVDQLVVIRRGDVDDASRTSRVDETLHRRHRRLCSRHVELAARKHEVDLRVDVPEDHSTSASRRFGLYLRPTFAEGRPSVRTMSAVKSFEPRMSEEPTP